jgi:hypothetical protein
MGYIPTTWLKHIKNKAVQCQVLAKPLPFLYVQSSLAFGVIW